MVRRQARILVILILAATAASAQRRAVIRKALSGVTEPAVSNNLPNIGQAMHLITVIFPTATAEVTGVQIRLEASFDNTTWFAISPDITTVPRLGTLTYQMQIGYAPWRYVRVRSLQPTELPFDVHYVGHLIPVVSVIEQQSDRFLL